MINDHNFIAVDMMFVTPLADLDCKEDETVEFTCEVNKPNCSAVWKKDGRPLPVGDKFEPKVKDTVHTLTIRNATIEDEADYTISVEDVTSTGGLFVEEESVEIIKHLEDVILSSVPKDVTFTCEVSKPNLSHRWLVNGKPLPDDKRYKPSVSGNNYTLLIAAATEKDDGEVSVLVKGHKSTADLIVEIPPVIKLDKKYDSQVVIKAGQMTIFEVPFSGWPEPTISWRVGNTPLVSDKRIREETIPGLSCVHVKSAKRSDTGIYSVEIVNDLGTISADIDLLVVDKPEPPKNLEIVDTDAEMVTLTWEAPDDDGGRPIVKYVIEKRDATRRTWQPAGESSSPTYTVTELNERQAYVFQVKAVNEVGQSEPVETSRPVQPQSKCSEYIDCLSPLPHIPTAVTIHFVPLSAAVPDAPQLLTVSDITSEQATVSWQPPTNNGGAEITGYMVERASSGTDRWIRQTKAPVESTAYTADNLMESMQYAFRILAVNKAGESVPCEPIDFVAKNPYDVPGAPDAPQVSDVTDNSMKVTWQPPTDDGGSPVISYYLEHKISTELRWSPATSDQLTSTEYTVKKLKTGTEYQFRVAAVNKAGAGKWSAPSSDVICQAPIGQLSLLDEYAACNADGELLCNFSYSMSILKSAPQQVCKKLHKL